MSTAVERGSLTIGAQIGIPGRTGSVFEYLPDQVYKEYTSTNHQRSPSHVTRLIEWRSALSPAEQRFLDDRCAWPRTEVRKRGQTVGFLMPRAPSLFWQEILGEVQLLSLQHFIHPDSHLKTYDATLSERLATVLQFAELVGFFERNGIVYPDIGDLNLLWSRTTVGSSSQPVPRLYLIDCDSAHIVGQSMPPTSTRTRNWSDERSVVDIETGRHSIGMLYLRGYLRHKGTIQTLTPGAVTLMSTDVAALLRDSQADELPRPAPNRWVEELSREEMRQRQIDRADPVRLSPPVQAILVGALILVVMLCLAVVAVVVL